jgi:GR25 family glycosyltransferase involved in LPS biosynthesis
MDNIDVIYYINLDHRIDRNEQLLQELQKMNIPTSKIIRIPGIYTKGFGVLGCGLSHLKALELFMISDYSNCLILEDDFMFSHDLNHTNLLLEIFFKTMPIFDVCMLAAIIDIPCKDTISPYIKKVIGARTASAYIVSRNFAPVLIQLIRDSTKLLDYVKKVTGQKAISYCHDMFWKRLQPQSNWYILNPKLGVQRESYSDIEECIIDHYA